ncbi:MAG: acyl-CoA dehydrogenase family protein, partial [Sneathiella sp.]
FRQEVRAFLKENLPDNVLDRSDRGLHPKKDDIVSWQKVLHKQGWIAPNWLVEYGGTGWSLTQKYIFNEEYFQSGAPQVTPFGIGMVGPVICRFGSDEQKAKYLPRILASDDWWCQGYSEPGSGSDLASLKTQAVRDGDEYVVNGQKIWTSHCQHADMMFCLVRTDTSAKAQEGISFLLIDMKSPGITIRPIIGLDLEHTLNEVFFDDVRVPVENRVGEENKGWTYAKFLLGHERNTIARVARSKYQLARLKTIAGQEQYGGHPLIENPDFKRKITDLEFDLMGLQYSELRYLSKEISGGTLVAEPSILKITGAEIAQRVKGLMVEALGMYGVPYTPDADVDQRNTFPPGPEYVHGIMADNLYQRAATIYGGTNEIQRNIIAKTLLQSKGL